MSDRDSGIRIGFVFLIILIVFGLIIYPSKNPTQEEYEELEEKFLVLEDEYSETIGTIDEISAFAYSILDELKHDDPDYSEIKICASEIHELSEAILSE